MKARARSGAGAFLILSSLALALASVTGRAAEKPELVLYTYDSLVAKGGLGPAIFPLFEKKCGCKVKALPSGDGGQLISRLQIDSERGKSVADVVLGLDEQSFDRARKYIEPWGTWQPKGLEKLADDPRSTPALKEGFLPYDYGYYAFMADREALKERKLSAPARFADLSRPEWKRSLLLEDPRTSTPGLAFVLYAQAVTPSFDASKFWGEFRSRWLTLASGWDAAYGLFLKKEAPLVWSYVTSQAYHEEYGDQSGADRRYAPVIFEEGQPIQIEGASIVRTSAKKALARQFLEFLISPEAQAKVAKTNWMFPARRDVELPVSFKNLPKPKKTVRLPADASSVEKALSQWSQSLSTSR